MERPFDIQLGKLHTRLIKMCSLVDEQVTKALKAVLSLDKSEIEFVKELDKKVDKHDVKIERACQRLFALNQPVATDLRRIMSALKINSNLERIGDLAVNISRNANDLDALPAFFEELNYDEISKIARYMVQKAFDSFIQNDLELGKNVILSEKNLDLLIRQNQMKIKERMKKDPENVEAGILLYTTLDEIERICDHAVNIAEEVYFVFLAESLKHKSPDEIYPHDDEDDEIE